MDGASFFQFYALDIIAGVWMLVSGLIGLAGKTLPFKGIDSYTKESLSKVARIMAIPYILAAGVCLYSVYNAYRNGGDVEGGVSLFAIGVLLVVMILHIILRKNIAKKK